MRLPLFGCSPSARIDILIKRSCTWDDHWGKPLKRLYFPHGKSYQAPRSPVFTASEEASGTSELDICPSVSCSFSLVPKCGLDSGLTSRES